MRNVVIVSACRTPIGSFAGVFKDTPASDLAAVTMREAVRRTGIESSQVDDVIFGVTSPSTDEVNIARVSLLKAGFPVSVPGLSIHRVCTSGMEAIELGAAQVRLGTYDIVLAGGVDNLTRTPYVLKNARFGYRMGHGEITDALWEGMRGGSEMLMGETAENLAGVYGISREEQDDFALLSHRRASLAIEEGRFREEIVPVTVKGKKGEKVIDTDEHPRADLTSEKLSQLPPAFKKGGTVTAGNSSGINDGAAAVMLMAEETAQELGLTPLARLGAGSLAAVEPEIMGYGPVPAVKNLLKKTGLEMTDFGLIECNEAFAAQYLVCERLLNFDRNIVNVNGGAVALGHPVGCTGARIVVTLLYEMKRRSTKRGLATLCGGNGVARALVVEAC